MSLPPLKKVPPASADLFSQYQKQTRARHKYEQTWDEVREGLVSATREKQPGGSPHGKQK